jgi:hypothetical protein
MSYEADRLWESFQTDPVGTYEAVTADMAAAGYPVGDPRVGEMYDAWKSERELAAYDATIEAIVNDPANADIDPNRLHTFVAAADGDFANALELYRADVARVLDTYGVNGQGQTGGFDHTAPLPGETQRPPVENLSPKDALHKAIEEASAAALRAKAQRGGR